MSIKHFLGVDLGAESGRTTLGSLKDGNLEIRVLNRFATGTTEMDGHLHWDVHRFLREMKAGMKACSLAGISPESIAVDTWGVDFALLDENGELLGLPFGYRDKRNDGAMEGFFERVSKERVYELTGIQFLPFNTVYQLYSMVRDRSPLLDRARRLLFMPDFFNYLFCGTMKSEFSFATTSQLYNPVRGGLEKELFDALGVQMDIMQEIVDPGATLGELDPGICGETGLSGAKVIAAASHDTGSAVAAVPAEGKGWAYISSGTWSLVGIETNKPIINRTTLDLQFTNEGGAEHTTTFLKNVMGLWLLQGCRTAWLGEKKYDYGELTAMAHSAPAFRSLVDPDHGDFLNPPDMPEAIAAFCTRTGQPAPSSKPEFVRCVLESLALKYRYVIKCLERISQSPIERIHIIGGGVKNELLCQYTADATGLPVFAGPIEATAIGNILIQAMGLGYVGSLQEIRNIVRRSFATKEYSPKNTPRWDDAYEAYLDIIERKS